MHPRNKKHLLDDLINLATHTCLLNWTSWCLLNWTTCDHVPVELDHVPVELDQFSYAHVPVETS
jgi:hypothetical protein